MGNLMAKDGTIIGDKEELWRFIPRLPANKLCKTSNKWDPGRRVFWTQIEPPQKSISSPSTAHVVYPEYWDIHEKIKSAFCNVNLSPYKGFILQFWALVNTIHKKKLLTTSNQPFSFEDPDLIKYRTMCMRQPTRHYEPTVAFLNKFPEVIPDLQVYRGIPFFDNAISFGFTCCISLPLFYHFPQLDHIYPVGVVQCCMKKRIGLLAVFNQLKSSLESVGLKTYPILPRYKNIDAIKPARDEIKEALEIVCQSHHLPVAQVWILNHKENYISYSSPSSIKEENSTRGLFVFKLCGYLLNDDDDDDDMSLFSSVIKGYYDTCDALPLRLGDGLVGKTLETRQPHFCRNIGNLPVSGILTSLSGSTECRCLVICLRSIHTTDDVDYAFEFLWPKTRDYLTLLEPLLLTLKTCLPNFKLSSGAQLGDELRVLDAGTSTSFNLLQENKCSLIPKALEKQPLLHGEQGPRSKKRKLGEFFKTDSKCIVQTDSDMSLEENSDVFMLAAYKENVVRFIIRTSNTLSYARKIVEERFNLDHGTYSMEYEFGGERASMDTDQDLDSCIKLWTSSFKRRGKKGHIVVLVSTP